MKQADYQPDFLFYPLLFAKQLFINIWQSAFLFLSKWFRLRNFV